MAKKRKSSSSSPAKSRAGKKKWWYDIGVAVMLIVMLVGLDYSTDGAIDWAYWPIAAILFFWVGLTLLDKIARN